MTNVTIHRCQLRIVRHGGWSWGPDTERLLQAAMRGIPDLIGRRLAAVWADGTGTEDVNITRTVKLEVTARMMELVALGARLVELPEVPGGSTAALEERIAQAVVSSFAEDLASIRPGGAAQSPALIQQATAIGSAHGALPQILADWWRDGELAARLALFSVSALETWYMALASKAHSTASQAAADDSDPRIDAVVESVCDSAGISAAAPDRETLLRTRLLLAAAAAGRLSVSCDDPALIRSIERATQPTESVAAAPESTTSIPAPTTPPARAFSTPMKPETDATRSISSAVPFLMLGVLSRIGYFETLSATLEALELSSLLPAFAAALAFKVLDPPDRGWRRTPQSINAASVFAGIQGEIDEPSLVHASRLLEDELSPLNATLANSLIRGHSADQPVILSAASGGLLLTDGEGVLPIAWANEFSQLLPVLKQLPHATILAPLEIVHNDALRQAHAADLHFITSAPPVRGERWRALQAPGAARYWTNDSATPAPLLVALAAQMESGVEQSQAWWRELSSRPGVPLAADADFERTLALGAGTALGMIAWTLWRNREATSPALALARFADLDARVRFSADRIQVRLPLGKRQQDLKSNGLLGDVAGVPWLGNRVVEFAEA